MKKTLKRVTDWVEWYGKNAEKASGADLLSCHDQLAVWSFRLGTVTAEAMRDYKQCYGARKIALNKAKQRLMTEGEGMSAAKAEAAAQAEIEDLTDGEAQAEAIAKQCKIMLDQCNKVLGAIQQRISAMKSERWNSDKTQNVPQ